MKNKFQARADFIEDTILSIAGGLGSYKEVQKVVKAMRKVGE